MQTSICKKWTTTFNLQDRKLQQQHQKLQKTNTKTNVAKKTLAPHALPAY